MKPTPDMRRVLLKDIAAATGYTVNTVSRALQNKTDIAPETCSSIQQVAAKMGYVRNSLASSLRSGNSRTIAVVVGNVSNPFFSIMIDAIHDLTAALGYTMLVLCSRDQAAQEQQAIRTAIGRQVEGLLLFPCGQCEGSLTLLQAAHFPFVLMNRRTAADWPDSVVCDEETGGYMAGQHLIKAGHRKLGFLYMADVLYSGELRIHGLLRAAREAGIPTEDVTIGRHGDAARTQALLLQWQAQGITGLFAFCDMEAWQLQTMMESIGLEKTFGLIGFDNVQGTLGFPSPICTIDGAMLRLADAAVALLIRRIQGDQSPPQQIVFPVALVCRNSCLKAE